MSFYNKSFKENQVVELNPNNEEELFNKYYKKILYFFGYMKTDRECFYQKNENRLHVTCNNLRYTNEIPTKENDYITGVGKMINGSLSFFGVNYLIKNINIKIYPKKTIENKKDNFKSLYIYASHLAVYQSMPGYKEYFNLKNKLLSFIDLNVTLSNDDFLKIKKEILKYNQENNFSIIFKPCNLEGIYCISEHRQYIGIKKKRRIPPNNFKILEKHELFSEGQFLEGTPEHIRTNVFQTVDNIFYKYEGPKMINDFDWKLNYVTNEKIFEDWSSNDFEKLRDLYTKLNHIKKFLIVIIFLMFIFFLNSLLF